MALSFAPARLAALFSLFAFAALPASAQTATADTGDTAWILASTALVLFMTLPGLALFYGGLVQSKNVLSIFMQTFAIACLMSLLWLAFGYSIAFGPGEPGVWGGLDMRFANGISGAPRAGTTIPEGLFLMYQMTFAIITPALILGAFAERANFAAVLLFSAAWLLLCYAPVAHWVWGGGFLAQRGVTDFAGGIVVHTTAGVSALIFAWLLGKRRHFRRDIRPPHSPGYVMLGAAMLWVGWFGFNAGSALGANETAARAMLVTHIAAAAASLTWMAIEWVTFKKPTLVGIATGMVAGLATITPAAGSSGPVGAMLIGFLAAIICYYAVGFVRNRMKLDDSLDVFAVHGVGGVLGSLMIPVVAGLGPMAPGLGQRSFGSVLWSQLFGVCAVAIYSAGISVLILVLMRQFMRLRVDAEAEETGLDETCHGESAYNA
jgi:Amt family ammonium transporter